MRFRYMVYPEAARKLAKTGLIQRIGDVIRSEDCPNAQGFTYAEDIRLCLDEMKKKGFLDTLPQDKKSEFQSRANAILENPENFSWRVHKKDGIHEEPTELEDLLLCLGWHSSFVLTPDEIWDYKRFGFDSITDFTGTIAAYIKSKSKIEFRKGLRWKTKFPDGRVLVNEIAGNMHYDLEIDQLDVTPYTIIDPFGNQVSFRPEFFSDRTVVMSLHNTECEFLSSLLKYVEQTGIHSSLLENDASELVSWTRSLGQTRGFTAEHISPLGTNFFMIFINYDSPISELNPDLSTDQPTFHGLPSDGEYYYGIHIGPNKELVLTTEKTGERTSTKRPHIVFQSREIDHILRGLFYQTAKGLGRTPAAELIGTLEYKLSGKYEQDLKRVTRQ